MTTLPSIETLEATDDGRLRQELRFLAVRQQAAVVRALADELERATPSALNQTLSGQVVEELARLGCAILEAATSLTRATPARSPGQAARSMLVRPTRRMA